MSRRARGVLALLALLTASEAAAQMNYGQCADRARDRYMRGQVDPAIGSERALQSYTADLRVCADQDARNRAHDARADQQRLDQLRARQRDDMYRNRR